MKKIFFFLFTILVSLLISVTVTAATAHDWLVSRQHSTTGLLDSYEGDGSSIAYTYDQACAIIAFLCENDMINARKVLDKMAALQNTDGSWYEAYRYDNGQVLNYYKYAGRALWMAIAINYYTRRTGDRSYINSAKKACDWILTLQDTNSASPTYGGIRGGYNSSGVPLSWYSTEYNHDAYSALNNIEEILNEQIYEDKALLVYDFIIAKVWDNADGRFYTGYNDTTKYLDPQSWSIPSIGIAGPQGQDFSRSITWAYANMRLSRTYNSQTIEGLDYDGYIASPNGGIWFEGTEQMVLAYDVMGDQTSAIFYHNQTKKAQSANGGIICSTGDGGISWPTNFPYNSVGATSWFIYASQNPRVNPFQLPFDTFAPLVTNVNAANITTSCTITWTTNENSDSQVEYGLTTSYDNVSSIDTAAVINHSVALTGLASNTTYHYRVKSKDEMDNVAVSADYSFTTPDTAPPEISNVSNSSAPNSCTIRWTTDENSDSQVKYGLTSAYGNVSPINSDLVLNHTVMLTGLSSTTTYYFCVTSKDAAGNTANSTSFSFITKSNSDTTPPEITNIKTSLLTQNSATIGWDTNENSDSFVEYGLTSNCEKSTTLDTTMVLHHSVVLSELVSNTTYYFRVVSKDIANNETISAISSFITPDETDADTTIPLIKEIVAANITNSSVTISWVTDENSDSQIEYGANTFYTKATPLDTSLVQNHTITITDLFHNTLYHYRVRSRDAAGNLALSEDYTFTTKPRSYSIKGFIKDQTGKGVQGVIVTLSGAKSAESLTGSDGYYEFTGLFTGAYTLSIAKAGYISINSSKTFTALESDKENQDFIVEPTYAIRGYIKKEDGSGVPGVTVSLQGDTSRTYSTASTGYYEFPDLLPGNYTVTLAKEDTRFIPEQRNYSMVSDNQDNQNYEALPFIKQIGVIIKGGEQGYVNPLKGEKIQFTLYPENAGLVEIEVYDLGSALIWHMQKEIEAGTGEIIAWDGKNNDGELVSSGIYVAHISGAGINQTKKIAIIK